MKAIQNLLIIGCGSIGERHLRCFQETGRAEITACDSDPECLERVRRRYGVSTHDDWEAALSDPRISAAVISTPAHLHVPMAVRALEEGKHVLIEKPLSTSLDEVENLIKIRDGRNLVAGVAYVMHFMPANKAVKKFLDKGDFGEVLHIVAAGGQHFPFFRPAFKSTYFTDHATGGGAIQDGLTHLINLVEWISGPSRSVYCQARHQFLEGVAVEDTVNLMGKNGNALVNYSYNLFQAPNEVSLTLHAEKGSIKTEFHRQRWSVLPLEGEEWEHFEAEYESRDALFIAQANAFFDAMEGKTTDMASLEEAIQTLRTVLAALKSWRSGTERITGASSTSIKDETSKK